MSRTDTTRFRPRPPSSPLAPPTRNPSHRRAAEAEAEAAAAEKARAATAKAAAAREAMMRAVKLLAPGAGGGAGEQAEQAGAPLKLAPPVWGARSSAPAALSASAAGPQPRAAGPPPRASAAQLASSLAGALADERARSRQFDEELAQQGRLARAAREAGAALLSSPARGAVPAAQMGRLARAPPPLPPLPAPRTEQAGSEDELWRLIASAREDLSAAKESSARLELIAGGLDARTG